MADWIKMRCNLASHPKVVRLAKRMSVTVCNAIGALHAVWTVADQHATEDGVLEMDVDSLDKFTEIPGFCRELEAVGWLEIGDEFVKFPEYHEHNGSTAKSRALTAKRVTKHRKAAVTHERYTSVTRGEEKRRDISPIVPSGDEGGGDDQDKKPKRKRFTPPSLEDVTAYCKKRQNEINPQDFLDHYQANGWKRGNTPIKDWKACVRTWEARRRDDSTRNTDGPAEAGDDYVG